MKCNVGSIFPFLLVVFSTMLSCSKNPSPLQVPTPVPDIITPVINITSPASPCWYNGTLTFSYTSSKASKITLPDGTMVPLTGSIVIPNAITDTTITLIATSSDGTKSTAHGTGLAYSRNMTYLANSGVWKQIVNQGYVGGTWYTYSPQCMPTDFIPTSKSGGTMNIYNSQCSILPNSTGNFSLIENETKIYWAQNAADPTVVPWTIEKLSADTLIRYVVAPTGTTRQIFIH